MVSKAIKKLEEYLEDILSEEPIPGVPSSLDEIKEEYNKELEELNQKKDLFDKEIIRIKSNYDQLIETINKQHQEEKEQLEFSYNKTIENLNILLITNPTFPDNEESEMLEQYMNDLKGQLETTKNILKEEVDKEKQELKIKKDMFDKELIRIQKDKDEALEALNKKLQKEKEQLEFDCRKKLEVVENAYSILEKQFNETVNLLNENGIEWGNHEQ
jgi:hypothetical protein